MKRDALAVFGQSIGDCVYRLDELYKPRQSYQAVAYPRSSGPWEQWRAGRVSTADLATDIQARKYSSTTRYCSFRPWLERVMRESSAGRSRKL